MFSRLAKDWGGLSHSLEPEFPVVFFAAVSMPTGKTFF